MCAVIRGIKGPPDEGGVVRKGFTLIELAIVLVILSVMALFMMPAIGEWIDNYRIKQAARGVISDLQFAKMKGMSLGHLCTINFTSTGYTIFDDVDSDYIQDAGEETLKVVIIGNEYKHVVFDSAMSAPDSIAINGDVLAFTARGLPKLNNGAFGAGSIYLKHTKTNKGRHILVTQAGRIRVTEY